MPPLTSTNLVSWSEGQLQDQEVAGRPNWRLPYSGIKCWFTFDPRIFSPLFPRLYEGIIKDVFILKTAVAWDDAPYRIMVGLLLPDPTADEYQVRSNNTCGLCK